MKSAMYVVAIVLCYATTLTSAAINIEDFGAVANETSYEQALLNGKAFNMAIAAANASTVDDAAAACEPSTGIPIS